MLVRPLFLIALALPATLGAQSSEPRTNSEMFSYETFADRYGSMLVAAFEAIPASRYDYRPTPAQQSIGYIAQHLESANYGLCGTLGGPVHALSAKDSLDDTIKARWPKDTLLARLRASLRYCDSALARLGTVESATRATPLLGFETDLAEHYSQLASYMRLIGLTPPSAIPPAKHSPIALPVSAMSALVGTYELAPSVMLDVTLSDGALIGKTSLGRPRRLMAESPTDFFVDGVDARISFARDASGAVTGLVLHQYGRDRAAKKIR